MTELCCFNRDKPPLLSVLSVVFVGSLLVALKRADLLMIRVETSRWTALLQMLEVTTIGSHSHVCSQVLDEARRRLVNMFLWQLFPVPDGLQGDFQLISRLRLRLEFTVLF